MLKRKEKPLDGEGMSVLVERELNKKEFGECSIDYCNQIRYLKRLVGKWEIDFCTLQDVFFQNLRLWKTRLEICKNHGPIEKLVRVNAGLTDCLWPNIVTIL